jgi:hypothetical protein
VKQQIEAAEKEASVRYGKTPTPPVAHADVFYTPPSVHDIRTRTPPPVPNLQVQVEEDAETQPDPDSEKETTSIFWQGIDIIHRAAAVSWGLTMPPEEIAPTPRSVSVRSPPPKAVRRAPPPPPTPKVGRRQHPNTPGFAIGAAQVKENMYDIPLVPLRKFPTFDGSTDMERQGSGAKGGGVVTGGSGFVRNVASGSGEIKVQVEEGVSPDRVRTRIIPSDPSAPEIQVTSPTPKLASGIIVPAPAPVPVIFKVGARKGDTAEEFAGVDVEDDIPIPAKYQEGMPSVGLGRPKFGRRGSSLKDIKGRVVSIEEEAVGPKPKKGHENVEKGMRDAMGDSIGELGKT